MPLSDWTFSCYWDRDADGSFAVDLKAYVMSATWSHGRPSQLDDFRHGSGSIVLDNSDGRFSPDNAAGPYYGKLKLGAPVVLAASKSPTTACFFVGYIGRWTLSSDRNSQTVTWEIVDKFGIWKNRLMNVPLHRGHRASDVIQSVAFGIYNVLLNGDLEVDLTGWSALNGAGFARDSGQRFSGDWSLKCTPPGSIAHEGVRLDVTSQTANQVSYQLEAWMSRSTAENIEAWFWDDVGGYGGHQDWQGPVGWTKNWIGAPQFTAGATQRCLDFFTKTVQTTPFYLDRLILVPASLMLRASSHVDSATSYPVLVTAYQVSPVDILEAIGRTEPKGQLFVRGYSINDLEDLVFINATNSRSAVSPVATFSDDGSDVPYADIKFQEDVFDNYTQVIVTSIGDLIQSSVLEKIWDYGEPLPTIAAGQTMNLFCPYSQPSAMAALTVLPAPASSTLKNYGAGADVTITAGGSPLVLTACYIEGYPFQASASESQVQSAISGTPLNPRILCWDMPHQGTNSAQMAAETTRLAPKFAGRVRRLTMRLTPKNDTVIQQMMTRYINDRVHVENIVGAWKTAVDADFFIEGVAYSFGQGLKTMEAVYSLEEA